jgi:bacterioferritin-associated ferredoxin
VVAAIVHLGVRTVKELREATEAGAGCRCCHRQLQGYLAVYSSSSSPADICSAR